MRYIYFSPHLDDAVLSAGGLISDQTKEGIPVEIWTFMSGIPEDGQLTDLALGMHTIWGTTDVREMIQIRKEEDRNAALLLGPKTVHFDFLDCIYRRGKSGIGLYEASVFTTPHADDLDIPPQIAQRMVALLEADDKIVVQLGVGGHVDHILVRKAAEMLNRPLVYIADLPYAIRNPEELDQITVGMQETLQAISAGGVEFWLQAIEEYASQLSSLFDSVDSMRELIRGYWEERRGIRFWTI